MLADINPNLFEKLPQNPAFVSNRGNSIFSKHPDDLRIALRITETILAEGNLSANGIRDMIVKLLEVFEIPKGEMKIYLREDRDAE